MRKLSLVDRIMTGIAVSCAVIGLTLKFTGSGTITNEIEVYSMSYNGNKASVIREERRLDFNHYYLLLNNRDKVEGTITDDSNKKIRVYNHIFSHGYEISNSEEN